MTKCNPCDGYGSLVVRKMVVPTEPGDDGLRFGILICKHCGGSGEKEPT